MDEEFRRRVVETLRRGEELPIEWARELFPPEKREYVNTSLDLFPVGHSYSGASYVLSPYIFAFSRKLSPRHISIRIDPREPTARASGLSEELRQAGLQVYEALAISELFYLAEQHPCAHIVVDHTVEHDAAHEVARHHITLRLARESTAVDVIWELSQLGGDATVQ